MIVMDFSQVILSNIMMQLGNHTNSMVDEGMVRHMVLNSVRMYLTKFKQDYGEMVIACDGKNSWRKEVFPYYKANRKKYQAESELNWRAIFECLHKIRDELKVFFPYRVIHLDHAEADDVIATLCKYYSTEHINRPVLILSGDKDFRQLQKYPMVKQYDPVQKKWIQENNPESFLLEHIARGDKGDGIPNVLSSDNSLVIGERQKTITEKRLKLILEEYHKSDSSIYRNWMRNKQLIDLSEIPEEIEAKILESYHEQEGKKSNNLMNYFIQNKLRNLMESVGDFV